MRRSWLRLFWAGLLVAAAAAGYLVSSGLGERLLHQEIETQLTRLLSGAVEIGEVQVRFDGGIQVEAREIKAYPRAEEGQPPRLTARRALAWVDFLGLLIGRLELSTLILEGPQFRVERDRDGNFIGLPFPPLVPSPGDAEIELVLEGAARRIEGLDANTLESLMDLRVADRLEIQDGTLIWIDHIAASPFYAGSLENRIDAADSDTPHPTLAEPYTLRLELFNGAIDRDWLTDDLEIDLGAVFVDGVHPPTSFTLSARPAGDARFNWTFSTRQFPLESFDALEGIEGLHGLAEAEVHLTTNQDGVRRLEIVGRLARPAVDLPKSNSEISQDEITFNAILEVAAKRIQLRRAEIAGAKHSVALQARVERPVTLSSRARINSRMLGIELEDIRDLAMSIREESQSALTLSRLTERIEDGEIRHVEATGVTHMREWIEVLSGRAKELPDNFVLGAAFENITVLTGDAGRVEDLRGEIEWVGDRLHFRDTTATFRGQPLPMIDAEIEGISHLVEIPSADRVLTVDPPSIPGLYPLARVFRPRNPNAPPPVRAIGLAIDELQHPIFRWPLRDLRVFIEPQRHGMQFAIREGNWGGASIEGDVVWFIDPKMSTVSTSVTLGPAPPPPPSELDAEGRPLATTAAESAATENPDRWFSGRFELELQEDGPLPFQRAEGFVRIDGDVLFANDIQIDLVPTGQIATRGRFELDAADTVESDLSFALTEGRLERVGDLVGLPPGFASGQVRLSGSFKGPIDPDRPLWERLNGNIRGEAQNGQVRTDLPLLLRLAKATEGYNPFANESTLDYESMTTTIALKDGVLSTKDFEIEGPLRVFANARINTNRDDNRIKGVVGIFLFRATNEFLDNLPLVRSFLPGSDRGLIGAYFKVKGPLSEPDVKTLPLKTLMSSVPSAIKAPFKVLGLLFQSDEDS